MAEKSNYTVAEIKVLEGLEGVRKRFDVVELSKKIKRKVDLLILSKELKIKPRALSEAIAEGRILTLFPGIEKSKASILSALRTDRDVKIFAEKHDLSRTPARKLVKIVREWNLELQKNPHLLVTQEEHDLIIGSLMGDASIRQREKNSCFRVAHSIKQEEYLNWKLDILREFRISEFYRRNRFINNREVKMIYSSTRTHPVFNHYRTLFYKNGRKTITQEILSQLNPRSLAIWVCDDGSRETKQGYIILCTNSYTLEEHKLMKQFFNERFGLDPTIGFRDKKYYYLRFKQDDTKKLIGIIKPFIQKSMLYKIGEKNE